MDAMDNISIYIINYNGEKLLTETIQSLMEQDYLLKTITFIDDGSSDKSISITKKLFPNVEIIGFSYNTGYPNKLRKMALDAAKTRYVFLTDNDIVYEPACLTKLLKTMKSQNNIGICTPRLMHYNDRNKIYVCWTRFHYLCTSISPLRDTDSLPETHPQDTLGGGIMLVDKEKIDKIGTIDDSYPMGWGEDAEIYARMKIAGYRTLYVPDAAGYHHAKEFITKRVVRPYGQARNRWHMMLTMYRIKTLILILPALFLYEFATIIMLLAKKLAGPYIKGIFQGFKGTMAKRKIIQKTRRAKDKDFLCAGPIYIPQAYLANPLYKFGIGCLDKIFSAYWRLIRILL